MTLTPLSPVRIIAALLLATGCGPQLPTHEVEVWSDCSGEARVGRYGFDDHSFESTGSAGDGVLSSVVTPVAEGWHVSGDDVVDRISIIGTEHSEFYKYQLLIPHSAGQETDDLSSEHIWCAVYRDDDGGEHTTLGSKVDCYFSAVACQARVDLVD